MKSSPNALRFALNRVPHILTFGRGLLLTATATIILATSALHAHADLPPWMQQVVGASSIESALYRIMQLPGLSTLYPRPPAEARTELSTLLSKTPTDPALYALRAHADEQSLDFSAAESDWKAYAAHSKDSAAAQLDLADYYHRRLQSQQEIAALTTAAATPSPAAEKFAPAEKQRSWQAYDRILKLADDQALPPEVALTTYNAWIERYPAEPIVRAALINTLIHLQRYDQALTAIDGYKRTFPQDAVFFVKASALVEYRRGSPQKALALYDASFQSLWPAELVQSYFGMLAAQHQQRTMLAAVRTHLAQNPDDLASAVRIFYYFQQQGNLTAAARAFDEYRLSKDARKAPWTSDELYTIATLLNSVGLYDQTARYDFALYNTPGKLSATPQSPQEAALSSIVDLLLTTPDQPIDLGAGNLSLLSDIASVDRGPGYLNGILSLWLNSTSPASEFHDEEQRATPYFRRAKASELLTLLDQSFPNAATRPFLHAALIRAYATYGDDSATIAAARSFLDAFPTAPERTSVAVTLADAYARTNNPTAEFALYDTLLAELARTAQGQPLTAATSSTPHSQTDPSDPNPESPITPTKPDLDRALDLTTTRAAIAVPAEALTYSQLLERYLGRLTTTNQLPQALAVLRHEIDRNPDEPLLYSRLADFLQQNNLASQQEEVYRSAIARFPGTTFYDKLARFYLRQKRNQDFATLTRQVVDTFHGTELEQYFTLAGGAGPQLYLQLNLYAHQRFPHELRFTRNLLNAYLNRNTANPAAREQLLREHWFEASDLRDQFFDNLSRTGKLDAEMAALQQLASTAGATAQISAGPTLANLGSNPAATHELAEANIWQSHFEAAAPLLNTLARAYPADTAIGDQASSVFRSLAYFDPNQIAQTIAIEKNLLTAEPASLDRLARIGDIYADSQSTALSTSAQAQLAAASPYWQRIAAIHPGQPDGYLQSATVFWDYFQFDDALTQIAAARKQFHNPALYAYEAGAIAENKNASAQAVAEYVTASVAEPSNPSARNRLLTLVNRPAYTSLIETATASAVTANPNLATLSLRVDILNARKQTTGIAPLLDDAIAHGTTSDQAADLAAFAQQHQLNPSYRRALQREVTLSADPVQRIQLQYTLAQSLVEDKDVPAAQTIIESVHRDNPKLLGVVRFTTDFYWNNKKPQQAIAALTQASRESTPDLAKAFTLEAATKSNQSGDYAGARALLAPLLTADPYDPRYLAAQADSYALAKDDAGLRDFYTNTLNSLKSASLPANVRRDKTALLRQGLILALTHLKDYEGAEAQHIALISAFPEDPDIAQNAALYALQYSRQPQLTTFLNKTVTDSPRDSRFAIALARVDTLFEDYPAALAAYGKAIAIRKDRADLYIARADLEEHQQNFDAACADYDRLYVLTYRDPQWMLKSAEARARQGKNELAVRALEAAYIDSRPTAAQNHFNVAAQLEKWNLLDQARTFADQGVKIAANDLLATPENRDGLLIYVRILTRQRHADTALATIQTILAAVISASPSSPSVVAQQVERQGIASVTDEEWRKNLIEQRTNQARSSFQAALRNISLTVAEFYTPEQKFSYAQLLDTVRANKPAEEIASTWIPALEAAGLRDRVAQARKDLLLTDGDLGTAQLGAYINLEQQRMDNAALAQTLEAYAASRPARERDGIFTQAVTAWSNDGDPANELRLLRTLNLRTDSHADLRDRYFQLLLHTDEKSLLAQAASTNTAYADAAANYILANASQSLAQSALEARARRRSPVWLSANTALLGLFFADTSARTTTAFNDTLADKTIAERLAAPASRNRQLVGADWFYYATRFGVYRTLNPSNTAADPEDFLPAAVEASPTNPASYLTLAQTYVDANHPEDAAREYHHALELSPRTPAIHRDIAITYWPPNWPPTNKPEALDQWNAALSLLRAQVDLRVVPESFWVDFAAIAKDAHDRSFGPQLRPAMDTVLRAYIAKNGNYRSEELLHSAFIALSSNNNDAVAWVLSLTDAARYPTTILFQIDSYNASWFPRVSLGLLYRRQLQLAQAASTQPAGDAYFTATSDLTQARIHLLDYLIDHKQDTEAQTLYDSIAATERQQDSIQRARIQLAAHQSRIPALLAEFTSDPATTPSPQIIASTANLLRIAGDRSSNRLLLEYVFQQKLQQHQLTPPDYLALAQARLDLNDTPAAVELLHRLAMLPSSDPNAPSLYINLDSAANLLERSNHSNEAIPLLATLANATPWNPVYRLRLAQAQTKIRQTATSTAAFTAIASANTAPYELRTQAATALRHTTTKQQFDSAELNLLTTTTITPQQASRPYFFASRIAAASNAPAATKPNLLREAIAISPSDSLRLAIFRAELALHHDPKALAAIKPLLQSSNGYYRPPTAQPDSDADTANTQLPTGEADNDTEANAPLPILLRTREARITFALAIASLYEKNSDDATALTYLQTAAALNRTPARAPTIAAQIAVIQNRIAIADENQSRRPLIHPALNQAVVVRPRLTTTSPQVQP